MVECRTPEREVGDSIPTAAVLCPWARLFTPRKYWLITQEAVAPSRHDWKIVDWDVKPQHKQTNIFLATETMQKVNNVSDPLTTYKIILNIYSAEYIALILMILIYKLPHCAPHH